MGRFIYDTIHNSVDIDDRTLAHLRVVIQAKLRRRESFMFTMDIHSEGISRRSFWMNDAVPIQFAFRTRNDPPLNTEWLDALAKSANSANGLFVVAEPSQSPSAE